MTQQRDPEDEYIKSWDSTTSAWTKRSDATTFAAFLAPELGINPKGVVVDKDGNRYRVYVPLLSAYWDPAPISWQHALRLWKEKVKTWASN